MTKPMMKRLFGTRIQLFHGLILGVFFNHFSIVLGETMRSEPVCNSRPLEIILVEAEPSSDSSTVSCICPRSSQCTIRKGMAKFAKHVLASGETALGLRRVPLHRLSARERSYYNLLKNSPILAEMSLLRMQARSYQTEVPSCEPLYVYLREGGLLERTENEIFHVGPAFINGMKFWFEGHVAHNFTTLEDVHVQWLGTIDLLSKSSLVNKGYFDTVVAHEFAHSIMQDLYGVRNFRRLEEEHMVATAGHYEGGITDPATALVEGFAEGFEAYLGEKYLSTRIQDSAPDLDRVFAQVQGQLSSWTDRRYGDFAIGIPIVFGTRITDMFRLDDIISDWLKINRQIPIRNGTYLMRGPYISFAQRYGVAMVSPGDHSSEEEIQADIEGLPETSSSALISKEGAVAFLVYNILKQGLAVPLFESLAQSHPRDIGELLAHFLPKIGRSQRDLLFPSISVFADARARAVYSEGLSSLYLSTLHESRTTRREKLNSFYNNPGIRSNVASLSTVQDSQDSLIRLEEHDLWIEFQSSSAQCSPITGESTRVRLNLATASSNQILTFLKTIDMGPINRLRPKAAQIIAKVVRENLHIRSIDEFKQVLRNFVHRQNQLPRAQRESGELFFLETIFFDFAFPTLERARECFKVRCISV